MNEKQKKFFQEEMRRRVQQNSDMFFNLLGTMTPEVEAKFIKALVKWLAFLSKTDDWALAIEWALDDLTEEDKEEGRWVH